MARERILAVADAWRTSAEDAIWRRRGDGLLNDLGMEFILHFREGTGNHDAIPQMRFHQGAGLGAKRVLHEAGARGKLDRLMTRMTRLKRASKKLGGEEAEMGLNRQDVGLGVQVVDGGSHVGASGQTQRPILNELEPVEGSLGVKWINHRGRVIDERAEKRLERGRQTFLVVSEGRVCQSTNDVDALAGFPNHGHGVGGEAEKRVIRNSKQFGFVLLWDDITVHADMWETTVLFRPRREQGHGRLRGRQRETKIKGLGGQTFSRSSERIGDVGRRGGRDGGVEVVRVAVVDLAAG